MPCPGVPLEANERGSRSSTILAVAVISCVVVGVMGAHYGFGSLLGHFGCDLYQPLADGFREGRLSLPLDGAEVAIFDSTPVGDRVYLHQGPFPAAVYGALDALAAMMGMGPFPKVLLWLLLVITHLSTIYLLLRRFAPLGVAMALLLTLSYGLSAPFLKYLAAQEVTASEVGTLFGTTLTLLGLLAWLRYEERPAVGFAALSAALLGCAGLARATYLAYGVSLLGLTLLRRRWRPDALCFAAITAGAMGLLLAYNAARFGDIGDFGNRSSLAVVWEDVVFNHGFVPGTLARRLTYIGEALEAWFGWRTPPAGDAWTLYYIEEDAPSLLERLNLLVLGLIAGVIAWLRALRKPGVEIALLCGTFVIVLFFVSIWQSVTMKYAQDILPMLFLLSIAGLHMGVTAMLARRGARRLGPRVFASILVASVVLTHAGGHGKVLRALIAGDRDAAEVAVVTDEPVTGAGVQDPSKQFCNDLHLRAEYGLAPAALDCSMVQPPRGVRAPGPWSADSFYHQLGLYRLTDERCFMFFYAGVTLRREPGRACRVELHLAPDAVADCARVELYLDGVATGRLSQIDSPASDRVVCARALAPSDDRQVRAGFLFEDGIDDIRAVSSRRGGERGRWIVSDHTDPTGPGHGRDSWAHGWGRRGAPTDTRKPLILRFATRHFEFRQIRITCDGEG